MHVEASADGVSAARVAADWLANDARRAVAERGRWVLGISGGRTPGVAFRELAGRDDVAWPRVVIVQIDERLAPDGATDRNLTDQLAAFAPALAAGARLVPMTAGGDVPDSERIAASLDRLHGAAGRPAVLDVAQLGLGADGHTASLVPDDPVLEVVGRDIALTGQYRGRRRLTLTYEALNRARRRLWIVTGADKAGMLARLVAGEVGIPAGGVNRRATVVLADEAALV